MAQSLAACSIATGDSESVPRAMVARKSVSIRSANGVAGEGASCMRGFPTTKANCAVILSASPVIAFDAG
ncbi:hypothetical protein [Dokdonella sp.]|uniref:hypothetical protein n=1 Tax=Dokdonella sp. TaxID=2291710 RepID=UPI0025BC624C|nr:hypothetical protein [Dokdonella sp.]